MDSCTACVGSSDMTWICCGQAYGAGTDKNFAPCACAPHAPVIVGLPSLNVPAVAVAVDVDVAVAVQTGRA